METYQSMGIDLTSLQQYFNLGLMSWC